MATPHVVGITALVKQRNPSWNPSVIASAISTTATHYDNHGEEILAQRYEVDSVYPSTHFDFAVGFVNPTRAIDPGLVLSSEFQDYARFLCSKPDVDPTSIKTAILIKYNRSRCNPADLNLPSVAISALRGTQTVLAEFQERGWKTSDISVFCDTTKWNYSDTVSNLVQNFSARNPSCGNKTSGDPSSG